MSSMFKPKEALQEEEVSLGLRMLMYDGMGSQIMGVVVEELTL
ncbi:MAG: hypothetical protein ACYTF1_01850 [Planctomycetota bacterium]|jgi:hypothetical protein